MPTDGRLRAWIEVQDDAVPRSICRRNRCRKLPAAADHPATQICSSTEDARQWVGRGGGIQPAGGVGGQGDVHRRAVWVEIISGAQV